MLGKSRILIQLALLTFNFAHSNPIDVVIAETEQGRGILGVVDRFKSKGIETEKDIEERKQFLRMIGYKL